MKEIEKISIDVVLLFPQNINNICKELNKKSDKENYVSFEDNYNPHITLGMGSIYIKDVEDFKNELKTIIESYSSPEIKIVSLNFGKYVYFDIEISKELKNIHTKVFDLINKYNAGDVAKENFYDMKENSSLIDWVNNFRINSSYNNYHPHITLGIGIKEIPLIFPIIFKPTIVGLFHLGIHGTCYKQVGNFNFKGNI